MTAGQQGDVIPKNWHRNMAKRDMKWITAALYNHKGDITQDLRLWFHPPEPPRVQQQRGPPDPDPYFYRRLFVWMPRRMWLLKFRCPNCPNPSLTSKGLYNRVREVVDRDSTYYMVAEHLECRHCKKTHISWGQEILSQMDPGHRYQFPAVLTHRGACDIRVIAQMRSRTLGNSSSLIHHSISEMHSEAWLRRVLLYLSECELHKAKNTTGVMRQLGPCTYKEPPPYPGVPTFQWILACYGKDVLSRLEEVKAQVTSTYGSILKMDSTKKVNFI